MESSMGNDDSKTGSMEELFAKKFPERKTYNYTRKSVVTTSHNDNKWIHLQEKSEITRERYRPSYRLSWVTTLRRPQQWLNKYNSNVQKNDITVHPDRISSRALLTYTVDLPKCGKKYSDK